ncbi:MAG: 30S ribosomal protein S20 [Calditrichaeota bacterium]|nr:MAG: 30S ribosomal protein S20 [Calditrichota bacterium]
MPNYKSAWKRLKTSKEARLVNRGNRSMLNTAIKTVLETEAKEDAQTAYNRAAKLLDHFVGKNLIHKNKASNQKSRLAKHVNSLG